MRVLVTGLAGFTGRYLAPELADAGHDVVPLDADVTDRAAVHAAVAAVRPAATVHLAANAFVQSDDVAGFYQVNQIGTYHLLDALAAASPGSRVLLASSANVYGNAGGMLDERTAPAPANHYAASKLAMEIGAALWADRLAITVVRPFNYTGRGQEERYLIPKIVAHFKRREPSIALGNLDVSRDFGDVRAVVRAYRGLLETGPADTYNIATGVVHSIRDVIRQCEALTGHRLEVRTDPALVRSSEIAMLAGDPARLRRALPHWTTVPLRDTLEWMLG